MYIYCHYHSVAKFGVFLFRFVFIFLRCIMDIIVFSSIWVLISKQGLIYFLMFINYIFYCANNLYVLYPFISVTWLNALYNTEINIVIFDVNIFLNVTAIIFRYFIFSL